MLNRVVIQGRIGKDIELPISIIISNIYVDEVVTSVKDIILSSKEKKKALKSKIFVALLVPLVIYSVYLMGIFIITCMQQGVPVNGDLESFRIVDNVVALKTNLILHTLLYLN